MLAICKRLYILVPKLQLWNVIAKEALASDKRSYKLVCPQGEHAK